MEHAPNDRRGFYSSFIAMGSPLAQVLANALLFGMAALLTSDQFLRFGWRVPFLFSFLLVAIGLFIRMRISETPAFEAEMEKRRRGGDQPAVAFGAYAGTVFRLMVVWAAVSIAYFIATVFILSFVTNKLGMAKPTAFAILISPTSARCLRWASAAHCVTGSGDVRPCWWDHARCCLRSLCSSRLFSAATRC